MKGSDFDNALTVQHQRTGGQFTVETGDGHKFVVSDSISLADNVIRVTVNGKPHTFQLVSKSPVGRIELQFLGSVFPVNIYREEVYKYLPLMPMKKVADTSRLV